MVLKSRLRSSAVTIAVTATAIPATSLFGRQSINIVNVGATTVYIGHSGVTTSNGIPVLSGASLPMDVGPDVIIYGIVVSGTEEVRILEGV